MKTKLLLIILFIGLTKFCFADSITFQNGVSPTAEYAGCGSAGLNVAGANNAYSYNWNGKYDAATIYTNLLKFDISAIPAGSTITDVQWILTYVQESDSTDRTNTMYKMKKDWNDVPATHAPAEANEPTWTYQYYNGTAWATAGCKGSADRDTSVTTAASVTAAANTPITFPSNAGMVALVQGWLDGTIPNYGVNVVGDEGGNTRTKRFGGAHYATAAYSPQLIVVYDPPETGSYYDTPYMSPGTMATDEDIGSYDWANPDEAKTLNSAYAEATLDGTSAYEENSIKLVVNNAIAGDEKSTSAALPGDYITYGAVDNLWGNTLNATLINADNFGVVFSVNCTGMGPPPTASYYLKATDFGFDIPANATINGVTAQIHSGYNLNLTTFDYDAQVDHIKMSINITSATAPNWTLGGERSRIITLF